MGIHWYTVSLSFLTVLNDTSRIGGKFTTGVIDNGGKFATCVVETGGKFAGGVVDTRSAPWLAKYLRALSQKFENAVAWGDGSWKIWSKKSCDTVTKCIGE